MSNPPFLASDILKVPHGFFSRHGGVSVGEYSSLNGRLKSSDDIHAVMENRRRVAQTLSGSLMEIQTAAYGCPGGVFEVRKPLSLEERPSVDGLVTQEKNIILGGLGRDCPSVLLADTKKGVIAVAHCGYDSVLAGTLQSTVSLMVTLGARSQNIAAVIGPSIGPKSYEIGGDILDGFGEEFKNRFRALKNKEIMNKCFHSLGQKTTFDLPLAIIILLQQAGVEQIHNTEIDTKTNLDYFSARRGFSNDGGCHIAAICL